MKKENEQLKVVEKRPVKICGLRQNCYVLDSRMDLSNIQPRAIPLTKYTSLEKKMLDNGFVEEYVEKDYPITEESVSSYIESADYRNDPMQAVANAPKRINLGDISDVQEFVRSNPVEATREYADILRKVASYFESQAKNNGSVVDKNGQGQDGSVGGVDNG